MALQRALGLAVTFFLLSLATGFKIPPGHICIGYRTVHPDQAKEYEAAGNTLVWNGRFSKGSSSFGHGVYLSSKAGEFESGGLNYRYCLVHANKEAIRNAQKIRMPVAVRDNPDDIIMLEHKNYIIAEYLEAMDADIDSGIRIIRDPDEYTRFMEFEVLIPPSRMNHNDGRLSLGVECKQTIEELELAMDNSELPTPDYREDPWTENIVGQWDTWNTAKYYEDDDSVGSDDVFFDSDDDSVGSDD